MFFQKLKIQRNFYLLNKFVSKNKIDVIFPISDRELKFYLKKIFMKKDKRNCLDLKIIEIKIK